MIESNRTKPSLTVAIAISHALGSSLDFLTGAVDDDRRSTEVAAENRRLHTRLHEIESGRRAGGFRDQPGFRGIAVWDTVAGTRRVSQKPVVTARVLFPTTWLRQEGLDVMNCEIIGVAGESMAPTLPDGCMILVNRNNKNIEDGKIFVIRTDDEFLVRRALKHKSKRWLLSSDNPNKKAWPTITTDVVRNRGIVGEVRWMWYSLP